MTEWIKTELANIFVYIPTQLTSSENLLIKETFSLYEQNNIENALINYSNNNINKDLAKIIMNYCVFINTKTIVSKELNNRPIINIDIRSPNILKSIKYQQFNFEGNYVFHKNRIEYYFIDHTCLLIEKNNKKTETYLNNFEIICLQKLYIKHKYKNKQDSMATFFEFISDTSGTFILITPFFEQFNIDKKNNTKIMNIINDMISNFKLITNIRDEIYESFKFYIEQQIKQHNTFLFIMNYFCYTFVISLSSHILEELIIFYDKLINDQFDADLNDLLFKIMY